MWEDGEGRGTQMADGPGRGRGRPGQQGADVGRSVPVGTQRQRVLREVSLGSTIVFLSKFK